MHGNVMSVSRAAGIPPIRTVGAQGEIICSGIGGCGTGVGVGAGGWIGAWQCGPTCRTMSVIRAAGIPIVCHHSDFAKCIRRSPRAAKPLIYYSPVAGGSGCEESRIIREFLPECPGIRQICGNSGVNPKVGCCQFDHYPECARQIPPTLPRMIPETRILPGVSASTQERRTMIRHPISDG